MYSFIWKESEEKAVCWWWYVHLEFCFHIGWANQRGNPETKLMGNSLKYLKKLDLLRLSLRNHHSSLTLWLLVLDCTPLATRWCIGIYRTDIIWCFQTKVALYWECIGSFVVWLLTYLFLCFIYGLACSRLSQLVSSYFINKNINESK